MMTEILTGSMNYLPLWILFIFQQQFIGGETLFGVKPIWYCYMLVLRQVCRFYKPPLFIQQFPQCPRACNFPQLVKTKAVKVQKFSNLLLYISNRFTIRPGEEGLSIIEIYCITQISLAFRVYKHISTSYFQKGKENQTCVINAAAWPDVILHF